MSDVRGEPRPSKKAPPHPQPATSGNRDAAAGLRTLDPNGGDRTSAPHSDTAARTTARRTPCRATRTSDRDRPIRGGRSRRKRDRCGRRRKTSREVAGFQQRRDRLPILPPLGVGAPHVQVRQEELSIQHLRAARLLYRPVVLPPEVIGPRQTGSDPAPSRSRSVSPASSSVTAYAVPSWAAKS